MIAFVDQLVIAVSSALREHDPLDPWLTESSWDEGYWHAEAQQIADRLAPGMDLASVREIVIEVLGDLLGSSADGDAGLREQSRRIDLVALAVVKALR